ncbi:MAG: hypothetical protein AAGM22_17130 [Acidobacteriota bacterium]
MGLLGRLFGGDPAKDLEKAERTLDNDPARAMALARKLVETEVGDAARALVEKARGRLFDNAVAMADEAEESEYFEDAAEWLDRALELLADDDQRQALEGRRDSLLDRAAAADEEPWQEVEKDDDGEPAPAFDTGVHVDAMIDMLRDDVAESYRAAGQDFRRALGAVLEDQPDVALEMFDSLLENGGSGVVHLERGRVRLMAGDLEGARDDFAAAWDDLGSGPLRSGSAESAPGLWADAQLGLGDPTPVVERLDDIADPTERRPDLCVPFAKSLLATEHFDAAEGYLRRARREMPAVHDLTHLHATLLIHRGDPDTAIHALESVVGPACVGGTCRPAAMHVPSLRLLVALHREHGEPKRADELSVYLGQMGDGAVADTASLQPDRSATVI